MSIKEQLKPLVWVENKGEHTTIAMGVDYRIAFDDREKKWRVSWYDYNTKSSNNDALFPTLDDAKKWVVDKSLPSKMVQWVKPIDPFATLNFYRGVHGIYFAHGKNRHYYIKNDGCGYHIELNTMTTNVQGIDGYFDSLEQAQAWCQADYDKYYEG